MFPEEGQAVVAKILLLFFVAFTMCYARARAETPKSFIPSVESVRFQ